MSLLHDLTYRNIEKLGVVLDHRRKMRRALHDATEDLARNIAPAREVRAGTFVPPKSYTQSQMAEQVATAALEGERNSGWPR